MHILATSDLHIDESGPRWDECQRVLSRIVSIASERRPSLILIPGDIYERRSTPRERLVAAEFVSALADVAPVVIVRGNHDAPRDLELLAHLDMRLPVDVVEDARIVDAGGCSVACVAWPTRGKVIDDGTAREQLRDVLRGLGTELQQCDGPRLLAGHFDIDGSVTGAGQPLIGGSLRVSLEDLALVGAQAVICGHVHRAQEFWHNGVPVAYCGSPFRTNYGETEAKSVLWIGIDDDRVTMERIDTGARDMHLFGGLYADGRLFTNAFGEVEHGPHKLPVCVVVRDAYVRLRYTVAPEHQAAARKAADELRARWLEAGAATVQLEAEVTASTRARAPEVSAARTIADKLDAYWLHSEARPDGRRRCRLLSMLQELEIDG